VCAGETGEAKTDAGSFSFPAFRLRGHDDARQNSLSRGAQIFQARCDSCFFCQAAYTSEQRKALFPLCIKQTTEKQLPSICNNWSEVQMRFLSRVLLCVVSLLCLPSIWAQSSSSSEETAVRGVVEKYFALYASKDLEGLMSLWSAKSPDAATSKQNLQQQFAAEDYRLSLPVISRLKLEGEKASLRATVKLTITDLKNQQQREQEVRRNFVLVREDKIWKVWRAALAESDLAEALVKASSEEEQERLLAPEPDLLNRSLLAALKQLSDSLFQKDEDAQALRTLQLAARIAERIGDRKGMGDALGNLGIIYLNQNRAALALEYLQKGLVIYEETGDKKKIAGALYYIGYAQRLQGHYEQALEAFHRSLPLSQESGDKILLALTLNNIGMAHRFQGRYELALEFYQQSRAISEALNRKRELKIVLNSIGNIYQAQGDYERALEFYQKSRALCEELGDKVALGIALYNIGAVYNFQGRYREALAHFQQSIKINEALGSAADKGSLATNLHSIGLLYRHQGQYDQALEYYRQSLKIREEIKDKFGISQTQNNIGSVYHSQGLDEQALEWFQKSLKLNEEMGAKGSVASSLSNIGDIYRQQGRYDLALEHLRKGLRLREEVGDRRGICGTLNNLSLLYQNQGSYAAMLETSRRVARLAEEINAPEVLWSAQEDIGNALRALGQPAEARQSLLAAIATVEALRQQVAGGGQQQQSFFENKLSPWHSLLSLLVAQNQFAEALTFAERSKARVLLDVFQAGRPNLRKSLSPQEQQTEEEQRLRLVTLNSSLTRELQRDKPEQTRVAELKANVTKARLEYEALETNLYVAHPELKVQRGEAPVIKADELAALLPDTTSALLEYVVADDQTHLFVITKADGKAEVEMKVYTLPLKRAALSGQVETFRQQLAGRDLSFRASAKQLYQLLLKPTQAELRGKTNLIIVPDDKLWELPFQALLAADNRYVLETSAVSYAPSLTVLREMKTQRGKLPSNAATATLLALGNPALGRETIERATLALRDGKLDPLPEAEQEVKALGQLYGAARSKIYVGAEAREDRVKIEAAQASILHFATHGIMNNAAPMYSHLVLAQGDKNEAKEDGLLEAWELMQLDLKAELAVLSACETARGRFGAGEGMIGLTWALFVAGVPSTVVSQWKVESTSTRDLMLSFYQQLRAPSKAKVTKAEALRQAALKLMKNPATSHPFYWASFVLVGNDR
jgi:CHAT domain-containing protein/tetratricopeptide (TPR) repeat protein